MQEDALARGYGLIPNRHVMWFDAPSSGPHPPQHASPGVCSRDHMSAKSTSEQLHSVSVAAVVLDDTDRVLAIRRCDNGEWQLPGGVLEPHETIEEGLVREVYEETRLIVALLEITGLYKHVERGILALVCRCRIKDGRPQRTDEAAEVRWMTLAEVDANMSETFSVRVRDAVDGGVHDSRGRTRIRNHNGRSLLEGRANVIGQIGAA